MCWLKESVGSTSGRWIAFCLGASGISPTACSTDLIEASTKVDEVEARRSAESSATHYRAHLDSAKLGLEDNAD